MGTLEQLFWSSTVSDTISTHVVVRAFNLPGLNLLVLWALSRVGGQSLLHIITTTRNSAASYVDISYFNSRLSPMLNAGGDYMSVLLKLNAIYLSSLMSPDNVQASPVDTWGNVKVPRISQLPANLSVHSSGWVDIQSLHNVPYASLLGVPVAVLSYQNTSFTFESTYFDLDCFNTTWSPVDIPFARVPFNRSMKPTEILQVPNGGFIGANGSSMCDVPGGCHVSFGVGFDHYSTDVAYGDLSAFPNVTGNNQAYLAGRPVFLFQSSDWDTERPAGDPRIAGYVTQDI